MALWVTSCGRRRPRGNEGAEKERGESALPSPPWKKRLTVAVVGRSGGRQTDCPRLVVPPRTSNPVLRNEEEKKDKEWDLTHLHRGGHAQVPLPRGVDEGDVHRARGLGVVLELGARPDVEVRVAHLVKNLRQAGRRAAGAAWGASFVRRFGSAAGKEVQKKKSPEVRRRRVGGGRPAPARHEAIIDR